MNYNIIVATCKNNGIGKDNKLPWNKNKEDLNFFFKMTKGNGKNAIIMGKNTFLSIGKSLQKRDNLILSKSLKVDKENNNNTFIFNSIEEIDTFCEKKNYEEVWVIGGESIYKQFLDLNKIKKIYKTELLNEYICDTFFPDISNNFLLSEKINLKNNEFVHIWNRNN